MKFARHRVESQWGVGFDDAPSRLRVVLDTAPKSLRRAAKIIEAMTNVRLASAQGSAAVCVDQTGAKTTGVDD
jgi:hypothetical protein